MISWLLFSNAAGCEKDYFPSLDIIAIALTQLLKYNKLEYQYSMLINDLIMLYNFVQKNPGY